MMSLALVILGGELVSYDRVFDAMDASIVDDLRDAMGSVSRQELVNAYAESYADAFGVAFEIN